MSKEKLLKTLCNGLLYGMKVDLLRPHYELKNIDVRSALFSYNTSTEEHYLLKNGITYELEHIKPHLRKLDLIKPLEDGSVPICELTKISDKEFRNVIKTDKNDTSCFLEYKDVNGDFCRFGYNKKTNSFWSYYKGSHTASNQHQLFDYLKSKHFNIEGLEENEFIEIKY
jgi:hypothetical protein